MYRELGMDRVGGGWKAMQTWGRIANDVEFDLLTNFVFSYSIAPAVKVCNHPPRLISLSIQSMYI